VVFEIAVTSRIPRRQEAQKHASVQCKFQAAGAWRPRPWDRRIALGKPGTNAVLGAHGLT
jgi:hypothetical protein